MHNNKERLVLGDLGLAKDLNLNKSLSSFTTVGTVYYKAPEFFNQDSNINYSEKIDIWYLLYFNEIIKFIFL
jgi:serine/threonine protein kinase